MLDEAEHGRNVLNEGATLEAVRSYLVRQLSAAQLRLVAVREERAQPHDGDGEVDALLAALAPRALPGDPVVVVRNI